MIINLVTCTGGKRLLKFRLEWGEYTVTLLELIFTAAVLWAIKLLFRLKYKKRF